MNLIDVRLHDRILEKKKRLDAHRPLSSSAVRKLQQQMQIQYIYNSNAIEGNTLKLRETQLIIEEGSTIQGKSLREHLEARNHPKAIEYVERIKCKELKIQQILSLHQIIMKTIDKDPGRFRTTEVRIAGANHIPPPAYEVGFRIKDLVDWYNRNPDELRPIELGAVFHHRFVHIHPFRDGNGRIGRLLMNLILLQNGYPMTVILSTDRKKYLDALGKADNGDPVPFVNFVAGTVEQSLDIYLRALEPTKEEDRLLTLTEASRLFPSFSQEYLSLLARKRRIGAVKEGRKWMVTARALKRYAEEVGKGLSAKTGPTR